MDKVVFVIQNGGVVAVFANTHDAASNMTSMTGQSFDKSDIAHVCRKSGRFDGDLHGYTFRYVETMEKHLWGFVGPLTQKRSLF